MKNFHFQQILKSVKEKTTSYEDQDENDQQHFCEGNCPYNWMFMYKYDKNDCHSFGLKSLVSVHKYVFWMSVGSRLDQ